MQRIARNQASEVRIELGSVSRRPGVVSSLDWLRGVTDIQCRVRTPFNTDGTWAAPSSGFPLLSTDTTFAADEGDTFIQVATSSPSTAVLKYGDTIAIGRSSADTFDEYTTARVVGVTGEGNTVLLGSPLPCDIASGVSVFSLVVYATVSASNAQSTGPATVDVELTDANGEKFRLTQQFRIVRYVPNWSLTPERLQTLMPSIWHSREQDDHTLQETIDAALVNELLPRLAARGIREDMIRDTEPLEPAHVSACRLQLMLNDPTAPRERVADARTELADKVDMAMRHVESWVGDDSDDEKPSPKDGGDGARFSYISNVM
jgi:hypothetical protein